MDSKSTKLTKINTKSKISTSVKVRRFSAGINNVLFSSNTLPFPSHVDDDNLQAEKMSVQETIKAERRFSFLTPDQFRRRRSSNSVNSNTWRSSNSHVSTLGSCKSSRGSRVSLFGSSFQIQETSREDDEAPVRDSDDDDDDENFPEFPLTLRDFQLGQSNFGLEARKSFCTFSSPQQKLEEIIDMMKNDNVKISEQTRRVYLFCEDILEAEKEDMKMNKPRAYTNASLNDLSFHEHHTMQVRIFASFYY